MQNSKKLAKCRIPWLLLATRYRTEGKDSLRVDPDAAPTQISTDPIQYQAANLEMSQKREIVLNR